MRSLREQFRNERQPPDGLIYQKIRLYEGALDQPADRNAANKWWAVLQNNPATKKHKYLRAFLRHGSFPQAFDALLPIPGLWAGMQIGVLHTLVSLRCDEVGHPSDVRRGGSPAANEIAQEILSYLEHIRHTFVVRIFGGDMELAAGADAASVLMLQSRVPKVSNRDLNFLQKRMNDGTLFPSIHDSIQRDAVWSRLQTIDVPIPTLQTFFSDLRYLAVARRAMRALLHLTNPSTKMSIDERLGAQHRMVGLLPLGEGKRVVRQGLHELWRFSFQYGLEMTGTARRQPRDRRTQEAASVVPDITSPVDRTRLWQHFFWLADHEGFSITAVGDFGIRPMADPVLATPVNSPDVRGEDEPVARRRGIPFAHTVDADRSALSKAALEQTQELRSVTPALIRQAQFRAFFRHLGRETRDSPTVNPPATRASTTPVVTFLSEPTIPPNTTEDTTVDTTEQPDTSPVPPATIADIPVLDDIEFDAFWNTGMDMWGNALPPRKLRVHIRVPDCPERTINVPSDRDRVIEFLDGLRACGFVLDIGHIGGGESVAIYEWHVRYPFDDVQATLTQEVVQYDVPSENRLKRRRRDLGPRVMQNAVDEAMAWINRQVRLSVVEEEI